MKRIKAGGMKTTQRISPLLGREYILVLKSLIIRFAGQLGMDNTLELGLIHGSQVLSNLYSGYLVCPTSE